ncbi:hypothetical protein CH298_02545 [Rhodococcoides fascians]|uniref:hypothetical protein n=1 Tax=Rhodococcoides fascians TaxID=1828 RepID=UPI000B9BB2D6|nr:hypothetical protein [Rhodococcus fascians]OZE92432.1 hypothetical protein CH303_02545 [Rhodococcus fascians]OZF23065.1 hypothetical protein CH298_02545 [Rhodococcus fascians]OZF24779.1 hypothetical protein CH297_02545 [Rhodococcus fascians]OZF72374.1 hypothetical protein CH308_02550 [Rhodococcus fascians]OZF73672.1 hypothetical protein CH307_02545 [Rhodococcus fascians]
MTDPISNDDKLSRRRALNKKILIGFAAIVAILVLATVIGAIAGGGDDDEQASATTTTTAEPTTEPVATSEASATTATAAPAPTTVQPTTERALATGCLTTPPDVLEAINASLAESGNEFAATAAVQDGTLLYVAGEVHRLSDGAVRSRDDLFVEQASLITPVTSTVKRESSLPDLSDTVGVDFTDAPAQAALDCARTY